MKAKVLLIYTGDTIQGEKHERKMLITGVIWVLWFVQSLCFSRWVILAYEYVFQILIPFCVYGFLKYPCLPFRLYPFSVSVWKSISSIFFLKSSLMLQHIVNKALSKELMNIKIRQYEIHKDKHCASIRVCKEQHPVAKCSLGQWELLVIFCINPMI